jgi:acetyltransferase-like isoleucine patch superfamily enzyme
MQKISNDFIHGEHLTLGHDVIIEKDVRVGDNVKLGHRATLKSGTIIGDNTIFDDHCISTGACYIGNNVNVRTGAIVSKATIIEDYAFIGPGVITNHTKNVSHGRQDKIRDIQLLTYIGYGSILGSQASILAGVEIAPLCIIGGGTVVVKNILEDGVYVGFPAQKKMDLPEEYRMDLPTNAGLMYMTQEVFDHLKKYMPALHLPQIKESYQGL